MKKKGLLTLAIAATLVCGSVGMITASADDVVADSETKVAVDLDWVDHWGSGAKIETDATTGDPLFTCSAYGQRVHSTSKVKLDGLTVTMSATQQTAQSRFGFGFSGTMGSYTLSEEKTVNVTWVPSQYDGQNRLYVNSNHADGTVCYTDQALTNAGFGLAPSYVATATTDDAYSFTFDKVSDTLWSVTVDIVRGQKFDGQPTPCTAYFADSNMVNILDENGECYISTWGMDTVNPFSLKVETPYVAPEFVEVNLNEGENTITIPAGSYAMAYVSAFGPYTFSWTGDATLMAGMMPIENGAVVECNPRLMGAITITPANAEAECTVVLTITAYVEPEVPAQKLELGANAVNVTVENYYCEGTEVEFTATEAGEYVLKAAEGEENADLGMPGEYGIDWITLPYTFTLAEGETVKFIVCTTAIMTLTEDTIDLVIEKVVDEPIDPPTSEDPIDPPTSEPTTSEPTTSEPTTSEPTTSEPEEEKKGGCGSVIGGVSAALTLIAAAAMVMKKKED